MGTPGGVKGGGMAWLLGGIVVGVLGAIFLPRVAAPYLPDALRGEQQEVAGIVEAKSAEVDRLLLTIGSETGAMLVTYTKNVTEIDLLIDVGDSVVLVVDEVAPFVDNAKIRRVMKRQTPVMPTGPESSASAAEPVSDPITEPIKEAEAVASDSSL